mmetsp:Transcript_38661/g.62383  ORF Transcript_38661/g.62383 Transcript_38661/m.62383 type:complete len:233 (-) Transcript_38661:552-1250(-)
MMRWSVGHEQEIVWRVLVMARHEKRHHLEEELLGGFVAREQSVSIDEEEAALSRKGQGVQLQRGHLCCVEAEELSQPSLDWVSRRIPNGLLQSELPQRALGTAQTALAGARVLALAKVLDEFQGESSAGAFVAIHCRCQQNQVGPQELLDHWQWDGRCLVDDQQLGLSQLLVVRRIHVLNCLPVVLEDIDPNERLVQVRVGRLDQLILLVLLHAQSIKALQDELKDRGQVLG